MVVLICYCRFVMGILTGKLANIRVDLRMSGFKSHGTIDGGCVTPGRKDVTYRRNSDIGGGRARHYPGLAQFGRALGLGPRGREFESLSPDKAECINLGVPEGILVYG